MNQPTPVAHAALADVEPRFVAPGLVDIATDGPTLIAGRCKACGATSFPKAAVCTDCLSLDIATTHLGREGVLYSFSVVHQAPKGWTVPYTLGYVDLPEGIRVLAHIACAPLDGSPAARPDQPGARAGEPAIDQKVRLATGRVGTGPAGEPLMSYVFTPL